MVFSTVQLSYSIFTMMGWTKGGSSYPVWASGVCQSRLNLGVSGDGTRCSIVQLRLYMKVLNILKLAPTLLFHQLDCFCDVHTAV